MGLREYHRLQSLADDHIEAARALRLRALDELRQHYGLVLNETLVRREGVTGVFREVLNYQNGVPWLRVTAIDPPEMAGRRQHFYGPWEIVTDAHRT